MRVGVLYVYHEERNGVEMWLASHVGNGCLVFANICAYV